MTFCHLPGSLWHELLPLLSTLHDHPVDVATDGVEQRLIVAVHGMDAALLDSTGRDVNRMIVEGAEEWKELVPEAAWEMAERHAKR